MSRRTIVPAKIIQLLVDTDLNPPDYLIIQ